MVGFLVVERHSKQKNMDRYENIKNNEDANLAPEEKYMYVFLSMYLPSRLLHLIKQWLSR